MFTIYFHKPFKKMMTIFCINIMHRVAFHRFNVRVSQSFLFHRKVKSVSKCPDVLVQSRLAFTTLEQIRMDHLEQENHKLREEVTTLRSENEILRGLVSLSTVAQSQPLSFPIDSTQAQTVASTTSISTVFASTPQHAMLEGYLWSTPLSSSEVFCPGISEVQAPFVQQTTHITQSGPLFPQAAMTYSSPLIPAVKQDQKPICHSESVVAYDRIDELKEKFDRIQLELKTLRGKELFGQSAYDLCLVPNVVMPPKFKVPDFEKYKGNTCPEIHLVMYVRKMSAQASNDELLIHCFQDSLIGAALIWYMGLDRIDIKNFNDLWEAFIQRYNYNLYLAPDRDELQAMTQNDNESFKAYAQRWRDFTAQVRPPLKEKELAKIFLKTLDQFYYENMVSSAPSDFTEMMTIGMRLEEGVREGRLVKESAFTNDSEGEN